MPAAAPCRPDGGARTRSVASRRAAQRGEVLPVGPAHRPGQERRRRRAENPAGRPRLRSVIRVAPASERLPGVGGLHRERAVRRPHDQPLAAAPVRRPRRCRRAGGRGTGRRRPCGSPTAHRRRRPPLDRVDVRVPLGRVGRVAGERRDLRHRTADHRLGQHVDVLAHGDHLSTRIVARRRGRSATGDSGTRSTCPTWICVRRPGSRLAAAIFGHRRAGRPGDGAHRVAAHHLVQLVALHPADHDDRHRLGVEPGVAAPRGGRRRTARTSPCRCSRWSTDSSWTKRLQQAHRPGGERALRQHAVGRPDHPAVGGLEAPSRGRRSPSFRPTRSQGCGCRSAIP